MGKKMITIAEIAFAVVFIIIMATIFRTVTNFGNNANNSLQSISKAIEDADIATYNGTTVSGDTVVSTINKLQATKNGVKMSYYVKSSDVKDSYGYEVINSGSGSPNILDAGGDKISGYYSKSANSDYKDYSAKVGETGFISPVENYKSNLAFNENGVLVGIIFEEV